MSIECVGKIKRVRKSYKQLLKAANFHGDVDCCGVITVAVLGRVSFGKAAGLVSRHAEKPRKRGEGTYTSTVRDALEVLGVATEQVPDLSGKTVSAIAKQGGDWVIHCKWDGEGHIFAIRDGKIEDFMAEHPRVKAHLVFKAEEVA